MEQSVCKERGAAGLKKTIYCMKCRQPMELTFEKESKAVNCPHCGFHFQYKIFGDDILQFEFEQYDGLIVEDDSDESPVE